MTTGTVRPDAADVTDEAEDLTRPGPTSAGWTTLSTALVALQVVAGALVIAQGFFFMDDYRFMLRAADQPLFSSAVLLDHWAGHFMPAGMAASWLLARAAPYQYGPVVLILTAMLAAVAILFRLVAIRLLGTGRAHVLAVALLATSMCLLTASAWWAAAINMMPVLICLLVAILLILRSPSLGRDAAIVAAVGIGLLFFEKAVLIPFALFGILWARDQRRTVRLAARATWRHQRRLWVACAVLLGLYTFAYLATRGSDSGSTAFAAGVPTPSTIGDAGANALTTFTTSLLGGPLRWKQSFEALAWPPGWLVLIALQTLALGAIAVLLGGGRRSGRWLVLGAGAVILPLALLVIGRPTSAGLLALVPRFFADALPLVALAVPAAIAATRWSALRTARAGLVLVVGIATVSIMAGVSTLGFTQWLRSNPTRQYVTATMSDLRQLTRPTAILDTELPADALPDLLRPSRQSDLFALAPDNAVFVSQLPQLRMVAPDGGLVLGGFDDSAAVGLQPGADTVCGWKITGDTDLPLTQSTDGNVLHLSYIATKPGTLEVALPDGTPTQVTIEPGLSQTYVALSGEGDTLQITNVTGGTQICTNQAFVGSPGATAGS